MLRTEFGKAGFKFGHEGTWAWPIDSLILHFVNGEGLVTNAAKILVGIETRLSNSRVHFFNRKGSMMKRKILMILRGNGWNNFD